ncbi:MAG: hypothetical protein J5I65_17775 [Aridibacter famidurans]|nr:hypothetical protein [Aridibacter famidurans]
MTENQTKEMFRLLTACVTSIQNVESDVAVLKTDVAVLKTDVAELKVIVRGHDTMFEERDVRLSNLEKGQADLKKGQASMLKEMRENNRILNDVVAEQARLGARVSILEENAGI